MMLCFIAICLFISSNAYYLACNSRNCITNSNIYDLHDIIKKQYYICYDNFSIYNREHYILCYNNIISFTEIKYTIKRCDNHNYVNDKQLCKYMSNDPTNCTINSIPIFIDYNMELKNSMVKSNFTIKLYNLEKISKKFISMQLQTDALDKNAYAIVEYYEKIFKIPEKKCENVRIDKVLKKTCKWYNIEYLEISYKFLYLL